MDIFLKTQYEFCGTFFSLINPKLNSSLSMLILSHQHDQQSSRFSGSDKLLSQIFLLLVVIVCIRKRESTYQYFSVHFLVVEILLQLTIIKVKDMFSEVTLFQLQHTVALGATT